MGKKSGIWKKGFAGVLAFSLMCSNIGILGEAGTAKAADSKISISAEQVKAKNASNHEAALIVDGDYETYWQSMPSNGEGDDRKKMYDHKRYIDITLDGTYSLSQIKLFYPVNDTYSNYYVYASADGENYDKIISKTSNDIASAEGDSYDLSGVNASYLRLNMAYNSNAFATSLSEIEVYGTKISDTVQEPEGIQVEDWEGSAWQKEWDKFESDQTYADEKVLQEMSSMVGRVLGDQWKSSFRFELRNSLEEGKDVFEIKDGADSTIVIRGNSGIAMASGFNYYLRNYVNVDYNPMFASNTALEEIKPVGSKVVKEAQFDLRYALNFCTYSYTMAFWNWDEYEEFLDWCAMNGINLILDIVGQEEVLRQTLREFKYTDEEIKDYICGPAYFAWFYMQNLYSQGGPLPNAWFEQRTELGRRIHDRMQTYGISPVIQAFAGQVPETFAEKNDGAVLTPIDGWCGFARPAIIKTYLTEEDIAAGKHDYFADAAKVFYEKQKNVFGNVSHYYAADPFHENGKVGNLDVATLYQKVQDQMIASDEGAIWVMQQWQGNLNAIRMSKLKVDKTLPLDLQADMDPQHGLFETKGAPWIYCMLHNFGGRMGLDGEIPVIASDPIETFEATNYMKGIGMTPEAMENSPVVYELLFDTNWSKDPIDYNAWLKQYAKRRAGGESDSLNRAWKILLETAYADKGITYQGAAETIINSRPADNFNSASTWGHSNILYNKEKLDQALLLLNENYEAFSNSPAYKYDLADVAEQVLCNAAIAYHGLMVQAKNNRDLDKFVQLSNAFLGLIDLSDQILSTTDEFMLGTWIEASRKMITDADDWTKDLFEFNARSLITTWGGERVGSLKDYSNRKWAGLTKDFYKERWAIWVRNRIADLKGEARNAADAKAEGNWFLWEFQWINRKSDDDGGRYAYETEPSDADLSKLAAQAYELYSYTNLEKNTGGTAQKVVNIAKGKPVSAASSNTQSGSVVNITDGDTSTGWIAEGEGPHIVEIDLEGTYNINEIILSIQQGATEFPYNWKLEYYNSDTSEWALLQENNENKMLSNTQIAKECVAGKIRLTISTSNLDNFPVEITEITVNGTEPEGEKFENLAQSMTVTATVGSGADAGGDLTKLTDENTGNIWSVQNWQNGGTNYPVTIQMQRQESAYTDSVEVYFESEGRPFTFYATAIDENGQEEKISAAGCETQDVTEKSYRMDVKKKITGVKIYITGNTGKGSFPGSWPALSEIRVMGKPPVSEDEPAVDFSDKNVTGITVSGGAATNKVIDGNKESFDIVNTSQNIVFDLHGTYYLSHVNLTFEKAGLGLKYKVLAADASGSEVVLCDESQSVSLLANRTVRVPVNHEVKTITFIHMGNNGKGSFKWADTRLYEFEAFGVEKTDNSSIAAEPSDAQGLLSGSAEYNAAADAPLTLTLSKAEDINMLRIVRGTNESKSLKYKAEYYDEAEKSWKVFADLTENESTESESCAVADGIISTKQIRITFTENITLSGISLYTTDYAGVLLNRISQIRTILDGITCGVNKGQYKQEAKDAAKAVLTQAESATGVTSETIDEWLKMVNDALDNFYETGVVYLDRNGLLSAMAEAKDLLEKQTQYELTDGQEDLQAAYDTARAVYETYNLTQADLDTAVTSLSSKVDEIKASLGAAIEAKDILEAKKELEQIVNAENSKKKEDYTAESWKQYTEAMETVLNKLNEALQDPDVTKETLEALKFQLNLIAQKLKEAVKITEIRLHAAENKTDLHVGETVQITADILPAEADHKTVVWASENETAASVSQSGLVSAKAEGTVKITAAAQDNSGAVGEITLKITKKAVVSELEKLPDVGTIHKTEALEYKITASSETVKTVMVQKSLKKKAKKITIPPTVKIGSYDYKVTEIKAKAFWKNTKITQVAIGSNVEKIGKQAFFRCKKLKKITITSKVLKSIGKKAFATIKKTAKITVPKKKYKKYKSLLKKAKTAGSVKILKK